MGISAAKKIANISRESFIKDIVSHLEEANFVTILSKILFRNPASITIYIHQPLIALPLWYRFVARILYPFADKIIALCDEEKKELIEQYHLEPEKIVLRPNTINIAHIQKLSHENLENPADEVIFASGKKIYLTAGRLVPQKNHQFLIQAFDTFHQKHPDSLLCILGE